MYMDMTESRGLPCVLPLEEHIGAIYLFSQQINMIFLLEGGLELYLGNQLGIWMPEHLSLKNIFIETLN